MPINWRTYGDMPLTAFEAELTGIASPMSIEAQPVYAAVSGHSRLFLAMAFHETKLATLFTVAAIDASFKNPVALMRDGAYLSFPTWREAAAEWTSRLITNAATYKGGVYAGTTTLEDLISVYAPASAGNNEVQYAKVVRERLSAYGYKETEMAITFGNVPHPGYLDRPIDKPEGHGWDNLGQRQPKFVVLHRMVGSLWGTDGFFRQPDVNALTDYGVGVADTDGDQAGVIIRWNDPRGVRAGWASGPVKGAYGDGLAIVNAYGLNAVNRDGVSIEISGFRNTPLDPVAFEEIAALMAYWWDQMDIPHTSAPINPATGISAVIWHQEFTLGTGKECPCAVVMNQTNALIARATAILKQYQTGASTGGGAVDEIVVEPIAETVAHAFSGAVVRDRPELSAEIKVTYRRLTALRIVGKAQGDEADNSTEWFLIKSRGPSNNGFIHSSGLDDRVPA